MRIKFLGILLFLLTLSITGYVHAEDAGKIIANPYGNPIDQLTGKIWQESLESNKEAILFGIDLGVTANYFADQKSKAKQGKKSANKNMSQLSWFDRCWMKAFTNISRKEAVKMVDEWYAAHPDQLDRPVLAVLWHEVVVPTIDKANETTK